MKEHILKLKRELELDILIHRTIKKLKDPLYFCKTLRIENPIGGSIPFVPNDYQIAILNAIMEPNTLVIDDVITRQIGVSTILEAYALWYSHNNMNKTISYSSICQHRILNSRYNFMFLYNHLDFKHKIVRDDDDRIKFAHGSNIYFKNVRPVDTKSISFDLVILEDFDYNTPEFQKEYLTSFAPITSNIVRLSDVINGKMIEIME